MIYPKKLENKDGEILLKIFLITSIIFAAILILINRLTSPGVPWAAFACCGIIYIWITVIYCIKRNSNIAGHVLLQMIIISAVVLFIDNTIGFNGWSVSIGVPIILIVANITMLILTIISHKKYIRYAIYQLLIVLISLISTGLILKTINVLAIIANVISIVNFIISLILSYKDIKEAIIRKFHM